MAVKLSEQKQQQRMMWALGDYPSAAEQIADVGPRCVAAADVTEDDAVLDVACGAGNATIPAAKTGADTTGLDITPELLVAGKKAADDAGVEIEWIEGDAEQLPFDEGSFDRVLSVFGCMFAPDHKAAAAELARVLKPGGQLAVCAWTPDGAIGKFFITVELEFERQAVDFTGDEGEGPEEFLADVEQKLPPIVAAKAALEPQGKWEALRTDLLALYEENNVSDGDNYRAPAEYLVIKGRKS
jgi:ubiquinone/menaquinone biosynthesis C-methylase UbiE